MTKEGPNACDQIAFCALMPMINSSVVEVQMKAGYVRGMHAQKQPKCIQRNVFNDKSSSFL